MAESRSARTPLRERALVQLTLTRFREFIREPEAVFWVFFFPMLLAAGLGLAFRSNAGERVPIAIVMTGPDAAARAAALRTDATLLVRELSADSAAAALRSGAVALVVTGGADGVAYRYDDTRPEATLARRAADDALQRGAGRADPLPAHDELVRDVGSRYIDFLIPGLLGMNMMGSGIWGLGFTIVEARRKRLLKRLMATPMRKSEYLGSFLLHRLLLLGFEVTALVGFGMLVFGVPLRGSVAVLALVAVVGALTFSALGLLIASRARTIEGASGLMNVTMMPMWVLSGVFFSSERFPDAVQPIIQALPLTAAVEALRGIMLRGAGLPDVLPQLGILGVWLVACFAVALKIFRWR
jgi:ABC-2 type transport system permease protein